MHVVFYRSPSVNATLAPATTSSGLPQQLSVDRLMRGDLYSQVLFRIAVAGCYMRYRGDHLMRTISVQTDWDQLGP